MYCRVFSILSSDALRPISPLYNLYSWFFHFHLLLLLPYPLFPSHSVFLASCFPFLSSLMCLSSPLLPPHLHITELLLFSAASCAVGFSPILPPVFSVFPPCLSLHHCYYLFCPVCLIILLPLRYSSAFSWPNRFFLSLHLPLQCLLSVTLTSVFALLNQPLLFVFPLLSLNLPSISLAYAFCHAYALSLPVSPSVLLSPLFSSPLLSSSLSAVFVAFRSVHI